MTHDWETIRVVIYRVQTYGLGIAISGGVDAKSYQGAIFVSDVLPGGPADGQLFVNDEIMSVNDVSLINATHAQAIHYLKQAGRVVELIVKRRNFSHSNNIKQWSRKPRAHAYSRHYPGMTIDVDSAANANGTFPRRGPRGDQVDYPYSMPSPRLDSQPMPYLYPQRLPSPLASPKLPPRGRSPCRSVGHAASVSAINHTDAYYRRGGGIGSGVGRNEDLSRSNYSLDCRYMERDGDPNVGGSYGALQELSKLPDDGWEMKLNRLDTWEDLGIELNCRLFVSDVHHSGAAYREGVRAGDTIVAVNGILATNISLVDASNLLHRPQVTLKFQKRNQQHLPDLENDSGRVTAPPFSPSPGPSLRVESTRATQMEQKAADSQPAVDSKPSSPALLENNSSSCVTPTRVINFHKDPQFGTGVRLTGGNISGIFVAGVHPHSAAEEHGIVEGDKLISVNAVTLIGKTKEEAVLELVGLEGNVELEVMSEEDSYSRLLSSGESGDSFFIRVHFSYDTSSSRLNAGRARSTSDIVNASSCLSESSFDESNNNGAASSAALQADVDSGTVELGFVRGAVFHVRDSLYGGVVGRWQAMQVFPTFGTLGLIPNSHRAEQLALTESVSRTNVSTDYSTWSGGKSSSQPRKKSSFHPSNFGSSLMKKKKSRSHSSLMNASFDSLVNLGVNAYERVVQKRPHFMRPVVIIGPTAQSMRSKLAREMPNLFEAALPDSASISSRTAPIPASAGVIKLSLIKTIIRRQRHCVLDIAPPAIDRLALKNFAPIVILLTPQGKNQLKEILNKNGGNAATAQWKRVWQDLEHLEQQWNHLFTDKLSLSGDADEDFRSILDSIQTQQNKLIFMSENLPDPLSSDSKVKQSAQQSIPVDSTGPQMNSFYQETVKYPPQNPCRMSQYEADRMSRNFARSRSDPHILTEQRNFISNREEANQYASSCRYYPTEDTPQDSHYGASHVDIHGHRPRMEVLVHSEMQSQPRMENGFHDHPGLSDERYAPSPQLNDSSRQFVELAETKLHGEDVRNHYDQLEVPSNPYSSSTRISPHFSHMNREAISRSSPTLNPSPSPSAPNLHQPPSDDPSDHFSQIPQDCEQQQPPPQHIHQESNKSNQDSATQSPPPSLPPKKEVPTEREILAETSGFFDHEGGSLEIVDSGVSLHIPPDALLKSNRRQHIFLKIYKDSSALKNLNKERGATLVSPLVMCGPHGLKFQKPVELRLPHYTQKRKSPQRLLDNVEPDNHSIDSNWSFSLLHASSETGKPQKWSELKLNDRDVVSRVDKETISIMVDHF